MSVATREALIIVQLAAELADAQRRFEKGSEFSARGFLHGMRTARTIVLTHHRPSTAAEPSIAVIDREWLDLVAEAKRSLHFSDESHDYIAQRGKCPECSALYGNYHKDTCTMHDTIVQLPADWERPTCPECNALYGNYHRDTCAMANTIVSPTHEEPDAEPKYDRTAYDLSH